MNNDFISIFWGVIFSILIVCGIVHGCGSCQSHLDKTRDEKLPVSYRTLINDLRKDIQCRTLTNYKLPREKELPVQYQRLIEDFSNDTFQFEMEDLKSNDPYSYSPTDILLQPNWMSVWSNWNAKRCKKLKKGYDLLNKYLYRFHSVTNSSEYALRYSSIILDDFSWKLECDKIRLDAVEKLYNLYDTNDCCWTVQGEKVIYLDETFRKKAEVERWKYYSLLDRLDKSMKDD